MEVKRDKVRAQQDTAGTARSPAKEEISVDEVLGSVLRRSRYTHCAVVVAVGHECVLELLEGGEDGNSRPRGRTGASYPWKRPLEKSLVHSYHH